MQTRLAKTTFALATLAATLVGSNTLLAQYAPTPQSPTQGEAPPEELKVLEAFPEEIVYEGIRLYDFSLTPKPETTVVAGTRIALKFKYEVENPRKVFVGAMPLVKGKSVGGFQPFELTGMEGAGEIGLICGGYSAFGAPPPEVNTLAELNASYQHVDGVEFMLYGGVPKQGKFQAPLSYVVIPPATFTLKDKFYLDRLIQEVISLRQRVQELEAAGR